MSTKVQYFFRCTWYDKTFNEPRITSSGFFTHTAGKSFDQRSLGRYLRFRAGKDGVATEDLLLQIDSLSRLEELN